MTKKAPKAYKDQQFLNSREARTLRIMAEYLEPEARLLLSGELAAQIAALDPKAAMVAISGDGGNEVMCSFAEYHFVAALAKPFSIDAVGDLVNRFL